MSMNSISGIPKKFSSLIIVLAVLTATNAIALNISAPVAEAATTSNDVQYSTTLDWSANKILISEGGFMASTTYECGVATLSCAAVSKSETALIPSALDGKSLYYLSPDNSQVIMTTVVPGSSPIEKLYSVQGNSLVLVSTLPTLNGLIDRVLWPSDGKTILFEMSDGSTQKFDTSSNKLTTLSSSVLSGASWVTISPDGTYIAYYIPATVTSLKREFGIIDTSLDKSYTLDETTSYWDLLSEGVRIFAYSPDSSKLMYLDDRSGYQTAYEVDLQALSKTDPADASALTAFNGTPITTKPYSIEDIQWETNSAIVFSANRSTPLQWSLYELKLTTGALTKITDYVSYDAPMEKVGTSILFNTADANGRLPKLFNPVTKKVSSFSIPGVVQSVVGTRNQLISEDGVSGVYMKPSTSAGGTGTATTTLLVWLHGGPDRQDSIEYNSYMSYGGYDWILNKVNQNGIPVLKLDYPGSLGYGTAYAESIKGQIGVVDASTTMQAITDFASIHGYKNIYVMGNSYGGYLALKLLTAYPDKISGAFSLSGVTDWQTLLTNVPSSIFSIDFNGAPNEANQSLYDKASIINYIPNIGTQKIIVIQGDADSEVPYSQSTLIDSALTAAGKNVDYTTLSGEDHIYENPASYTLVCNKALSLVGLPSSSLCSMQ